MKEGKKLYFCSGCGRFLKESQVVCLKSDNVLYNRIIYETYTCPYCNANNMKVLKEVK